MKLSLKEFGEGDPLIILHELPGSLEHWQESVEYLSPHFHIICTDLSSRGGSDDYEDYSYDLMALDIRNLMLKRNHSSAFFMGHSIGGKVVMEFALSYPEMVDKLVILEAAPVSYDPDYSGLLNLINSINLNEITSLTEAAAFLHANIPEPRLRCFLLKNLHIGRKGKYTWKFDPAVICRNYLNISNGLDKDRICASPALFLKGGKSDLLSRDDLPFIKCLFPNSMLDVIKSGGHWVHTEDPKAVFSRIKQFLM